MRDFLIVAFLLFVTSIDSIFLIYSSVRMHCHPHPRKARLLILLTLCAAHPIYSLAADSFFRLPGLRLISAILIVFFSFRLAGESPFSFRVSASPKRTSLAVIGTTVWLDAMTSIDTSILVSAASPSFAVTAAANIGAMLLLVAFAPVLYRYAIHSPWLKVMIAAFMSLSAVLQLRGESAIGALASPLILFPAGLLMLLLTAVYGWRRRLR